MNAPMFGSWTVTLQAIRPFSIHGDPYYELHVTKEDLPGQVLALRVAQHALSGAMSPGEQIEVTFLMGQVTAVKRA
jgi:hypothetical protein